MSEVIAGISVDGRERDTSLELDMGLMWPPGLEGAGACRPVSYLPADGSLDSMVGDFTIWLKGPLSAAMEGAAQPHGTGSSSWRLSDIQGVALPGVNGTSNGDGTRTLNGVLMTAPIESQGRKGPGLDLFGYKFAVRVPCDEASTSYSPTIPPIIAKKFGAHQIQDWSVQLQGITAAGGWGVDLARRTGRRYDANLDMDHVDFATAHAIIKWLRVIRGDAVTFPAYAYGATYAGETISVRITRANLSRSNGLFWTVHLETALASSTATVPHIWNVSPAFVPSGAIANVVIYGSGFDSATTVTVGGVAATVTAWTSGKLYVTVPSGTVGQYEVVAANAQGSATGTLWRYDAGDITFGTGGALVATTAVAITKNQLVGLNSSGNVILADAVLGIVAVGYANADAAAGAALQVNQTGHATPIPGLTDGEPVYLGTAGNYATTPPSGATITQQVGIGTATGCAVNPQQAVYD